MQGHLHRLLLTGNRPQGSCGQLQCRLGCPFSMEIHCLQKDCTYPVTHLFGFSLTPASYSFGCRQHLRSNLIPSLGCHLCRKEQGSRVTVAGLLPCRSFWVRWPWGISFPLWVSDPISVKQSWLNGAHRVPARVEFSTRRKTSRHTAKSHLQRIWRQSNCKNTWTLPDKNYYKKIHWENFWGNFVYFSLPAWKWEM